VLGEHGFLPPHLQYGRESLGHFDGLAAHAGFRGAVSFAVPLAPDVDFPFYPVDRIPCERQRLADSHTSDGNEDHEHLHQRVGYVVDHRSGFSAAQFHRFEIRLAGSRDELHGIVFLTTRNETPFLTVTVYGAHHTPELGTKTVALFVEPLLYFERLDLLRHAVSPMRKVVASVSLLRPLRAVVLLLTSFGLAIRQPVV